MGTQQRGLICRAGCVFGGAGWMAPKIPIFRRRPTRNLPIRSGNSTTFLQINDGFRAVIMNLAAMKLQRHVAKFTFDPTFISV